MFLFYNISNAWLFAVTYKTLKFLCRSLEFLIYKCKHFGSKQKENVSNLYLQVTNEFEEMNPVSLPVEDVYEVYMYLLQKFRISVKDNQRYENWSLVPKWIFR